MKFAVKILLFVFIVFLSTPTIVATIEKNCDTSIFFGMNEEEIAHKEIKVFKEFFILKEINEFKLSKLKSSVIAFDFKIKHSNGYLTIFSPPPNC